MAAMPVVALFAGLLTRRLRALEIILASVSLALIISPHVVTDADSGAFNLNLSIGVAAILGVGAARCRPWLATAAGVAASRVAHRLQAPGVAAMDPEAAAPSAALEAEPAGKYPSPRTGAPHLLRGGASAFGLSRLSRRQQEVVVLVLQGFTARQIGTRLFISERTVETHLANVYERLEIHSREQLIESHERVLWSDGWTRAVGEAGA
jgi:DNA-binding CsgD family transcriptional regulator